MYITFITKTAKSGYMNILGRHQTPCTVEQDIDCMSKWKVETALNATTVYDKAVPCLRRLVIDL